jgi:hypothetical protein
MVVDFILVLPSMSLRAHIIMAHWFTITSSSCSKQKNTQSGPTRFYNVSFLFFLRENRWNENIYIFLTCSLFWKKKKKTVRGTVKIWPPKWLWVNTHQICDFKFQCSRRCHYILNIGTLYNALVIFFFLFIQ